MCPSGASHTPPSISAASSDLTYLRAHPADASCYAAVKRRLAASYGPDRHGYTGAKVPHVWEIIRRADDWAQEVGWVPPTSDV